MSITAIVAALGLFMALEGSPTPLPDPNEPPPTFTPTRGWVEAELIGVGLIRPPYSSLAAAWYGSDTAAICGSIWSGGGFTPFLMYPAIGPDGDMRYRIGTHAAQGFWEKYNQKCLDPAFEELPGTTVLYPWSTTVHPSK